MSTAPLPSTGTAAADPFRSDVDLPDFALLLWQRLAGLEERLTPHTASTTPGRRGGRSH